MTTRGYIDYPPKLRTGPRRKIEVILFGGGFQREGEKVAALEALVQAERDRAWKRGRSDANESAAATARAVADWYEQQGRTKEAEAVRTAIRRINALAHSKHPKPDLDDDGQEQKP